MLTKIRFRIEYGIAYFKMYFWVIMLGIVFGTNIIVFQKQILRIINLPSFTTKKIGYQGLVTMDNLPVEVTDLISFGLTRIGENGKPEISELIQKINVNGDYSEYSMILNNNFYWHDGKKVTAYDIDEKIDGITFTALSEDTLKIKFSTPLSSALTVLSKPLFKKNLIGIGPYKINAIEYRDGYIKKMSLNSTGFGKPKIVIRFYQTEVDLINAFKMGEVNQMEMNSSPKDLENWPKIKISKKIDTTKKYLGIFFDTEKLKIKQLRQALAYATVKTENKSERCFGSISPNSWAYNPEVKEYSYSEKSAKELFDKNKIDKIDLTVNERGLMSTATKIKQSWENTLGIKVNISLDEQFDGKGNFEAVLAYGGITTDPDQYGFWHSTQKDTNITKFNNSRIDKLLEQGREIYDYIERKTVYYNFQKHLAEESPVIFLNYPVTYVVSRVK